MIGTMPARQARKTAPAAASSARALVLGLLSAAVLAACSAGGDDAQPVQAPEVAEPASAAAGQPGTSRDGSPPGPDSAPATMPDPAPIGEGGTVGGDGSPIQLDALTGEDLSGANLAGELGCNFSQDGGQPLLVAMGVVGVDDPAQGVVKVAGYVEPVHAPGGYNGMLDDPVFNGQGKTVRIEETGAAVGNGESPPRPATLTYQRADGASRVFEGLWQCGP